MTDMTNPTNTVIPSSLATALALLAPWTHDSTTPEPNRMDIGIEAANLLPAVRALIESHWGYLSAITGLDLGVEAGLLEALYHFCQHGDILTLRVRLPRDNAAVNSIHSIIPSVTVYERELSEMFGITIQGAANTERLFLPDDWPSGVYPLRKDFNNADAQA